MAKGPEYWVCPACSARIDIAPLGLYAEAQCPHCYHTERVHVQLGNFRLDAILGIGGMSVVYRAFDVELHRPVALKVLNDTFRDQPDRIERFENESAMMARVRHENVTSVYSAGRAYGQFYIAMELVEGVNLEYMVTAEATMAPKQALTIIEQVACGLQAAHEAGLLHRDMKPGNILITPEGRAKVIDFGLAMDSHEGDTEEIIWATPYYVPPETLQRKPEDVRTDIYALGMTLRFLLTGVEKFDGEPNSLAALVQCKRRQVPLAKMNTGIAPELCDLVDHMTAFLPAERPGSYAELLDEIHEVQALLQDMQSSVTPARRRRRRLIAVGTYAVGIMCGVLAAHFLTPSKHTFQRELINIIIPPDPAKTADPLKGVLEKLEDQQYDSAVTALLDMSQHATDPCMGAWCAQLARVILGSRYNDPAAADRAHELFLQHIKNEDKVLPSGRRVFDMLASIDRKRYPGAADWTSGTSEWNATTRAEVVKAINTLDKSDIHPIIKTMEWFVLSEKASWLGFVELGNLCLSKIKEAPSLGDYEVISEMLSMPSIHKRASGAKSERARAEASMRERDFNTAISRFDAISQDERFDDVSRSQAQVLSEVCTVAAEMFATMQRKFPDKFRRDLDTDRLALMARGMSAATRSAVWSDGAEKGHATDYAIDGNMETRWCAADGNVGHEFVLDMDNGDQVRAIIIHWENDEAQQILFQSYEKGVMSSNTFDKTTKSTRIDLAGRMVDTIKIVVTKGPSPFYRWASIREIQLEMKDGRIVSPASNSGRNDFSDELRAVCTMLAGRYKDAFAQMDYIISKQGYKSDFAIVAASWKKRWLGGVFADRKGVNTMQMGNAERFEHEELIRMCQNCKLIRVLPGQQVRFRNRSSSLQGGNMMFCPADVAQELQKKNLVEIMPAQVVAILGLKGARFNSFTVMPGEIQPCRKMDAQHFQEVGAAKILSSVEDLWEHRDIIKTDPFPVMLRRVVDL